MLCVLQVMKATGFYRGLYAGTQLDSKSFQVYTYIVTHRCCFAKGLLLSTGQRVKDGISSKGNRCTM